jgi:hypothetical protein
LNSILRSFNGENSLLIFSPPPKIGKNHKA